MRINYNEIGKVASIGIQIDSFFASISYKNKAIDWESVTSPHLRDSLKTKWEKWAEGKDLEYELRDRPDLAIQLQPEIKPQPNWVGFNTAMMLDSDYDRIQNATTNQTALRRLETLAINNSENVTLIRAFWNQVVAGATVSAEAVKRWNEIAQSANMPFSFDADGKMQLLGGEL